jgi:class 3 adenylate cyclase
MDLRLKRAVQCAYAIQDLLDDAKMGDMMGVSQGEKTDVQLSVKCGIGVGNVSVLHIGGVLGRMEYLAVGEPLLQAFQAEHHASPGQIIVSEEAWKCLDGAVEAEEEFSDKYIRLSPELSKVSVIYIEVYRV